MISENIAFYAIQENFIVGDIDGNADLIKSAAINSLEWIKARIDRTDILIVTPELAVCGYPPMDLLLNNTFIQKCIHAAGNIAKEVEKERNSKYHHNLGDFYLLIGHPSFSNKRNVIGQKSLANSATLYKNGVKLKTFNKTLLPTYNVFDESRYFEPCENPERNIFYINGHSFGVTICEDIWNEGMAEVKPIYKVKPVEELRKNGAQTIINLSASPYFVGKAEVRYEMIKEIATTYGINILYVNQFGGNDSLVFDGSSQFTKKDGRTIVLNRKANDSSYMGNLFDDENNSENYDDSSIYAHRDEISIKDALVIGIRDYVKKLGLSKAIIGMSGGVDSAVVTALAVEALGAENVIGVTMPTKYNSEGTKSDARLQAERLKIEFREIDIESLRLLFNDKINGNGNDFQNSVASENIQARIRGNILMAISNDTPGSIVLSTGNKSELSMGYFTIYGDSCGGLSVLGDVYKTQVFEIAGAYVRSKRIPKSVVTRPPSAELRENQIDENSLPPYDILDEYLKIIVDNDGNVTEDYIEKHFTSKNKKYDQDLYDTIMKKVANNEFKRRQTAPCIAVNPRPWNVGWRRPIVQKYF